MAKTIKKAQRGKDVPKGYVRGEMTGRLIPEKEQKAWDKSDAEALNKVFMKKEAKTKPAAKPSSPKAVMPKPAPKKKMMYGGMAKAKSGKKFPDLTGDGKVTKADILKGRGVFKYGGKMKKMVKKSK